MPSRITDAHAVEAAQTVLSRHDVLSPEAPAGGQSQSEVYTRSFAPSAVRGDFSGLYELADRIGGGGMGVVYKARDQVLHRTVAIKVMHDEMATHKTWVQRFYKEAQITAQLEHPGIVPTYGVALSEAGQPQLAMRLIRGGTLQDLIDEAGTRLGKGEAALRGLEDRLELFARVCDAVHFAHEHGVVHRDLKPDNIMVGPHRDAYVMDWGLATLRSRQRSAPENDASDDAKDLLEAPVEVADDPRATRMGELLGTPSYMPPEQALGELEQVDGTSDQFAMGMTLQELVTLAPARNASSLMIATTHAALGEREPIPKWVPRGLAAIIEKATSKHRAGRYASLAEMADDIRRFMRDEELNVLPDPLAKKVWRRLSAHKGVVLSGLLLLVIAVAALTVTQITRTLTQQREQAAASQRVADQVGLVSAKAQSINARARGIEISLAWLAGGVEHALSSAPLHADSFVRPTDLAGPSAPKDTAFLPRYNQRISFERAVIVRAPNSIESAAARDEMRLAGLETDFKRAFEQDGFARGIDRSVTPARVHWTYVGTPSGVILNYPGASGFTPDFDPRERPWYKSTKDTLGPQWGGVYGDATGSGTLLPCNLAVYDRNSKLLAVLGIDFHMSDFQEMMSLPEVKGYQRAWLLNAEGQIVAEPSRGDRGGAGDFGKRALAMFEPSAVRTAIARQPSAGQVIVGPTRYLYASVPAVGFTYLVAAAAK